MCATGAARTDHCAACVRAEFPAAPRLRDERAQRRQPETDLDPWTGMWLLFGGAEGRIEDPAAPGRIEELSEQAALDDFALTDRLRGAPSHLAGVQDGLRRAEPRFGGCVGELSLRLPAHQRRCGIGASAFGTTRSRVTFQQAAAPVGNSAAIRPPESACGLDFVQCEEPGCAARVLNAPPNILGTAG